MRTFLRPLMLLALSTPLLARQTETFEATVPVQSTNWVEDLLLPRFDPAGRLLTSVEVTFATEISGTARAENLDATGATLDLRFSAEFELIRPGGGVLAQSEPMLAFDADVTAFDGTIDFAGGSGVTFPVSASDSHVAAVFGAQMAPFIGTPGDPGFLQLLATATGSSIATGSGNLVASFQTDALAVATVVYTFELDCDGNGVPDAENLPSDPDCNGNGLLDVCEPDCDQDGTIDACEPDCNLNSVPDDCEGLGDCDSDGVYDPCEEDCDANGVPDDCDGHGDCDSDGVPDPCEFDCHGNGIPDECEWFFDCDSDGLPDVCEEDCDGSGFPDDCEPLFDCDSDGVPDACEEDCDGDQIPDDCDWFAPDCNQNGVPDSCDIGNGSADGNFDGVPDECQCADWTRYCQTTPNSFGPGATLSATGTTSLSVSNLVLSVDGAPPGQFGLFYYGPDAIANPVGAGIKCVGGAIVRGPIRVLDSSGRLDFPCDFGLPMYGVISPDSTWRFQFVFRDQDASGAPTFDWSDALEITFCP